MLFARPGRGRCKEPLGVRFALGMVELNGSLVLVFVKEAERFQVAVVAKNL